MQILSWHFNFNASAEIISLFKLICQLNSDTLVAGILSQPTHKTLHYCSDLSSQTKVKLTTVHAMVY
jgi:hypothetical protein